MIEQEVQRWKKIAVSLWGLLDDIDTASDMAKDDEYLYRQLVHKKHVIRHKYLVSDGYSLYFPEDLKQRQILDLLNQLRNKDCVEIQTCYKGHGTTCFVYLGQDEKRHIAGSGDSLEEALVDAVRKEFYQARDGISTDAIVNNTTEKREWPIMIDINGTFIGGNEYIEVTPGGIIVDGVKEFDISEIPHWHCCVQAKDIELIKGKTENEYTVAGSVHFIKYIPEDNDEQSNSSG